MESEIYEDVKNYVHSTALIDPNVIMGTGNVIMEGVIIRSGVQIGDNNTIGPYTILGDYPEKKGFFEKIGKVIIGSRNRFTKQCTVDSGTDGVTIIKDDCILLKNAHLGHEAYLEDGVIVSCNAVVGGHSHIGKNSNLGLNSVVHQRITVPEGIILGMSSVITKKTVLQSYRKYAGVPARDIGGNDRFKPK